MVKLCLTIGVSNAENLVKLPGAITAANEIGEWAKNSGFDTWVVTDEESPVTIDRVQSTLLEMLPKNQKIEHFVLHFAGHGLRIAAEQNLWLPTNWKTSMRGIYVEVLKKRLYRYGVQILSIFSDACRSLPADIESTELTADGVLGEGPYAAKNPIIDRFNAVMDGDTAYMIPSDGVAPARCVFSTVLVEGLCGHHESAFDEYLIDCVIPESLASFATKRLEEISRTHKFNINPECYYGLPRDHAIYYKKGDGKNQLPVPKWPAPRNKPVPIPDMFKQEFRLPVSDNEDVAYSFEMFETEDAVYGASAKVEQVEKPYNLFLHVNLMHANTNLVIVGETPVRVWNGAGSKIIRGNSRFTEYCVSVPELRASQILVEFKDGLFASAVIFKKLVTVLFREENGIFRWECVDRMFDIAHQMERTFEIVSDFQNGNITADQVDLIAARIREFKHANPTLGAISSYLYDSKGDMDNIHRMAYFYSLYRQPMPFDIPLMGLLSTNYISSDEIVVYVPSVSGMEENETSASLPHWAKRETKEITGHVAGSWPWLRQGWQFIEDPAPQEEILALNIKEVIPYLLPSQFSAFDENGANILIQKFNLRRSE